MTSSAGTVRSHPIYAAWYDRFNTSTERGWLGEARQRIAELARGRVLEIGAGTGMNLLRFQHMLPDVTEVVACEPDPAYRRHLEKRIVQVGMPVRVLDSPAERLALPDGSVDTVVSTLTMCSVDDPARVAAEMARVLRPDGQVLLFEHVRSNHGRFWELTQTAAIPVWRWFIGGCRPNRPTLDTLRTAGFDLTVLDTMDPPGMPRIICPFVTAVAKLSATASADGQGALST